MLAALFRARLRRLAGDLAGALSAGRRAHSVPRRPAACRSSSRTRRPEALFTEAQTGAIDRTLLETLARQAAESGETPQQILATLARAALARAQRRLPEALAAAGESLALARACADAILTGEALLLLMGLHQAAGETAEAQTCRADLLALAQTAFAPFLLALEPLSAASLRESVIRHS